MVELRTDVVVLCSGTSCHDEAKKTLKDAEACRPWALKEGLLLLCLVRHVSVARPEPIVPVHRFDCALVPSMGPFTSAAIHSS